MTRRFKQLTIEKLKASKEVRERAEAILAINRTPYLIARGDFEQLRRDASLIRRSRLINLDGWPRSKAPVLKTGDG